MPHGATADNFKPCEGCWVWANQYQVCDGSCKGHTERQWLKLLSGHRWDGRALIKNGRKP